MSALTPSPAEIRDYILRRLPEARRTRLEELYFRDDSLLERVEQAEDELISDYVLRRLSPADRKTFEDSLLEMPYYRDRIETTTQIRLKIGRHPSFRKNRTPEGRLLTRRAGFLAALSLLAVLFVAALASALRLKGELEMATRTLAAGAGAPGAELQAVVLPPPGGPTVSGIIRPGTASLVLVLPRPGLPPPEHPFRISLRTGDRTVWESGALRSGTAGQSDVAVRLPAGVPPPGRYDVILAVAEEVSGPRLLATLEFAGSEG